MRARLMRGATDAHDVPGAGRSASVAFFDVDETLITMKSMIDFLAHHLACEGEPQGRFPAAKRHLADVATAHGRAASNRAYYRLFAGAGVDAVAARGRDWFAHRLVSRELFHPPAVAAFEHHRDRGDVTVLVSGSFSACLDPIAEHLGADRVLSSDPVIGEDGRYTGDVHMAMIGERKGSSARELIRASGVDPADCHAYGDHASDLPLLAQVGHPVMVGDDALLSEQACGGGWLRLPGIGSAGVGAQDAGTRTG
jgi:HAD superfamily hydrolase (TIGR01490 family)